MEIKPGYLYHIKDEFFDIVNGINLFSTDIDKIKSQMEDELDKEYLK